MVNFILYLNSSLNLKNAHKLNEKYSIFTQSNTLNSEKVKDFTVYVFGDYIGNLNQLHFEIQNEISLLKGNFILILVKEDKIKIITSLFNTLPIYYSNNFYIISSSLTFIEKNINDQLVPDKKFILECLMFNYSFLNRTLNKNVSLLPCHHFLEINNDKTELKRHFDTTDFFTQSDESEKLNINQLSDLFIETSRQYMPEETFYNAFTSGFDGRTLVSCASQEKKQFKTFSFGKKGNADFDLPIKQAAELNIPHKAIDLSDPFYIKKDYKTNTLEYIQNTNGGNGFLYPHVLHSAKLLSQETDCLLTGYAGSELFRAMHIPGALSSEALVKLFSTDNEEEIKKHFFNSKTLQFININEFKTELNELIDEVLDYKRNLPKTFTKNQKLYYYVFEELIRKIFGQWVAVQQNYMNVRTPFIDYTFIQALLKTKYAGVNNDFMTENPYKRMKGQLLYAYIIKKTSRKIYYQKTGKGYRPVDIINPMHLPKIVLPFFTKRLKRKIVQGNLDNLSIISGFKAMDVTGNLPEQNILFNSKHIKSKASELKPNTPEADRDTLLMSLSLLLRYEKNNCINGL